MEQPVQRSGMPRGCLIGLVIGGILLVVIVIAFSVLCFNREKVIKWSVRQGVVYTKEQLSKEPVGIDTTRFNALADQFLTRLETGTLSDEQMLRIGPTFQNIMADKKVDSTEVRMLATAMITMFPDLEQYDLVPGEQLPTLGDTVLAPGTDTVQDNTEVDSVGSF